MAESWFESFTALGSGLFGALGLKPSVKDHESPAQPDTNKPKDEPQGSPSTKMPESDSSNSQSNQAQASSSAHFSRQDRKPEGRFGPAFVGNATGFLLNKKKALQERDLDGSLTDASSEHIDDSSDSLLGSINSPVSQPKDLNSKHAHAGSSINDPKTRIAREKGLGVLIPGTQDLSPDQQKPDLRNPKEIKLYRELEIESIKKRKIQLEEEIEKLENDVKKLEEDIVPLKKECEYQNEKRKNIERASDAEKLKLLRLLEGSTPLQQLLIENRRQLDQHGKLEAQDGQSHPARLHVQNVRPNFGIPSVTPPRPNRLGSDARITLHDEMNSKIQGYDNQLQAVNTEIQNVEKELNDKNKKLENANIKIQSKNKQIQENDEELKRLDLDRAEAVKKIQQQEKEDEEARKKIARENAKVREESARRFATDEESKTGNPFDLFLNIFKREESARENFKEILRLKELIKKEKDLDPAKKRELEASLRKNPKYYCLTEATEKGEISPDDRKHFDESFFTFVLQRSKSCKQKKDRKYYDSLLKDRHCKALFCIRHGLGDFVDRYTEGALDSLYEINNLLKSEEDFREYVITIANVKSKEKINEDQFDNLLSEVEVDLIKLKTGTNVVEFMEKKISPKKVVHFEVDKKPSSDRDPAGSNARTTTSPQHSQSRGPQINPDSRPQPTHPAGLKPITKKIPQQSAPAPLTSAGARKQATPTNLQSHPGYRIRFTEHKDDLIDDSKLNDYQKKFLHLLRSWSIKIKSNPQNKKIDNLETFVKIKDFFKANRGYILSGFQTNGDVAKIRDECIRIENLQNEMIQTDPLLREHLQKTPTTETSTYFMAIDISSHHNSYNIFTEDEQKNLERIVEKYLKENKKITQDYATYIDDKDWKEDILKKATKLDYATKQFIKHLESMRYTEEDMKNLFVENIPESMNNSSNEDMVRYLFRTNPYYLDRVTKLDRDTKLDKVTKDDNKELFDDFLNEIKGTKTYRDRFVDSGNEVSAKFNNFLNPPNARWTQNVGAGTDQRGGNNNYR